MIRTTPLPAALLLDGSLLVGVGGELEAALAGIEAQLNAAGTLSGDGTVSGDAEVGGSIDADADVDDEVGDAIDADAEGDVEVTTP